MHDEAFNRAAVRSADARILDPEERRNVDVVLAVYAAFAGTWDVEEQRAYYTADFVDHSTMHGATFDDLAAFLTGFRSAFPEGSITIERILADGKFVVAQVQGRLSPRHPADQAIEIYRFEDGRIAEHWDVIRPHVDLGNDRPRAGQDGERQGEDA